MAFVKLSDGSFAQIPDGLPDDAAQNFISRIEAANKADKQTTPGGIIDPFADPNAPTLAQTVASYGKAADTALGNRPSSWLSSADTASGGWLSAAGKMGAHVGADIALGVPSAFAGAANALSHVAQNYGLAGPSPDLPIASQSVPAAFGVTPETSTAGQATEALLALAAGNKLQGAEKLWSLTGAPSALVKAPFQYGAQWLGSNVGGAVAGAVDPRLREAGEFVGGVAPLATSPEAIASKGIDVLPVPVRDAIRAPNAADVYAATQGVGAATGNPNLTPTAGMVGGPITKGLEKSAMSFPGVNIPVLNARARVGAGLEQGVNLAAEQLAEPGTNVNTSPGGAGAEWRGAAQDQLTNAWRTAQNAIDAAESEASSRNLTDANGNPQLVTGMNLANLGASLRSILGFSNQGRVISTLGGAGDATVNSVLNDIGGKLQDQDPVAGNNMRASLAAHQAALNNPNIPPAMAPILQDRINALNQNIAANQGVSFDTLRRIKTDMQTAARGGDYVSGLVADTLRDALGDHLNNVAPDLGQRYSDAVDQYKQAMNLQRSFTGAKVNAVGNTTNTPGVYTAAPGDTTLANAATNLLRNPQNAEPYLNTPGFRNVLAAVVSRLGQKNSEFNPTQAAKDIGGVTDAGQGLLTRLSASQAGPPSTVVPLLNDVRTAGNAFDLKPGPAGLSGALATTALAEGAAERAGWLRTLAGGGAAALGMERPGAVRALAGRPLAWRDQLNLPALVQVANMQAQARNRGQ